MKNFIAALTLLYCFGLFAADTAAPVSAPAILSLLVSPLENAREFSFTAAASGSADALTFHWDFGDGSGTWQGGASETHVFPADGTYNVKLIVSEGNAASEPHTVSVRTAENRTVFLLNDPIITKKSFSIVFLKSQQNALNFAYQHSFISFPSLLSFTSKFQNALITVYIGNIQIDSMLLNKTKAKGFGTVSFNYKKGSVEYKSKGDPLIRPLLADYGAINATFTTVLGVPLEIDINNGIDIIGIFTTVPFAYKAQFDKKGVGK